VGLMDADSVVPCLIGTGKCVSVLIFVMNLTKQQIDGK